MTQKRTIQVKGTTISVLLNLNQNDYICLTDMAKGFEEGPRLIEKWLNNKSTIDFLGVWEQLNNPNFKNMNSVVIYEEGHVLSGYMSKDGNSYKLIGIENTVKGKGIKHYNNLEKYNGIDIRVVDSEIFAILEIFKNDMANPNEVAKQALDLTAKKYNLDPNFNYDYSNVSLIKIKC